MTLNKSVKVKRGPCSFFVGATYPVRALAALIKYPSLRGYVVLPILLNLIVGVTLYALLLNLGLGLIDDAIASLPGLTESVTQWHPNLPALATPTFSLPTFSLPRFSLPRLPLPHWSGQLPHWMPHLPHWSFNGSLSLPHWQINQPNWTVRFPAWQFPAWLVDLPLGFLVWLLRFVLTVLLLLITGFIFLQFGVLLGAPWYGKLSEELERLKTGQLEVIEVGIAGDIGRAILYELKKVVLTIAIGLPLLLIGLLPGLGTAIATLGSISLGSTIVCLDFLDATLERRRLRFRQKLGIIGSNLPATAGFALVCFGLVSIPLINLLGIPICVTAGTLFVCDRILPVLQPPQSR